MWNRPLFHLATAAVLACLAAGPATSPTSLPTTLPAALLEPLLKQLSGDEWKIRQNAQDQIVALGPDILPDLRAALKQTHDEEIRTRLEASIKLIEQNSPFVPTLISLHYKDSPPQMVLNDLSKQARIDISVWPDFLWRNAPKSITLDADREPFWSVMRRFCEQTKLTPDHAGGRGLINLVQRNDNWAAKPAQVHPSFLITVEAADRNHHIDYADPKTVRTTFNLHLKILVDPKIKVVRGPNVLNVEAAVDDKGNSLLSTSTIDQLVGSSYNGSWLWQMTVPLTYNGEVGKTLASLKGKARFLVPNKSERWEIKDPLKAQNVQKEL